MEEEEEQYIGLAKQTVEFPHGIFLGVSCVTLFLEVGAHNLLC